MRWLKYTLIGLTSLVIAVCAMLVTLVLLLDPNHLSAGLVHVVNRTTDNQLEINGPLEIDLSLSPSVRVSDIYFKTAADDFELSAAEIDLQVDIPSPWSNYVIVRRFIIKDSIVTIRQQPEEDEDDEPFEPVDIKAPVIGTLSVENFVVNYSKPGETKPLQVKLDSLQKEGKPGEEVFSITGAGAIDGTAFRLEGESGALATLLTTDQPYPFNFHFEILQAVIHAEGRIINPRETADLDIAVQIKTADLHDILDLLHVNAPDMGSLEATATVTGTLEAPRLDEINFNVSKDTVAVQLSGTVGNLFTAEDIQLDFSSTITDAKLLAWLLPEQSPRFNSIKTSGKLSGSAGALTLSESAVAATGPGGHKLELAGSTRIVDDPWPLRDLNATLAIASPDTKFVRQFTAAVPLLGPLSGSARLSMDADALVIKDLKLTAGNTRKVQVNAQGGIGHISFMPSVDVSKMDLKINISGSSARAIGELVDTQLADFGPVEVNAQYSGSMIASTVRAIHLQAGGPEQLQVEARGDIKLAALTGDKPLAGLELDVNFEAPSTASLTAIAGTGIPALGSLKGTAHVSGAGGVLAIKTMDINVNKGNDFQLSMNGSIADLEKLDRIDMKVDLSGRDLNALGQLFEVSLPKEGVVRYSARVRGSRENLRHNGRASLRNTEIITDLTASFSGERPRLAGSINTDDLDINDIGIYLDWQVAETSASEPDDFDEVASEQATIAKDLFSKQPIDLSALHAIDLDLEVSIKKLSSTAASLADIYSHIQLNNGKLDIKPLKYSFDNEVFNNAVMINSATKPPTMSLLLSGDDIDLGQLLTRSKSQTAPIRGMLAATVDLKSRGQSPDELANNLDGKINFITENARIDKSVINLVTVDVIGWAITNMLSPKKDVNIECAMLIAHFNKGMGTTDLYVIDTPDTLIKIDAKVDLVKQTMDVAIVPRHKHRFFMSKQDPMKIYGPIANPQYQLVSAKDLALETGRAALLAPLTISAELLDSIARLIVEPDEPKPGSCDKFLK